MDMTQLPAVFLRVVAHQEGFPRAEVETNLDTQELWVKLPGLDVIKVPVMGFDPMADALRVRLRIMRAAGQC